MFETGRRSAISTSELGLYSDRGERYNRNKYGPAVRKFVIVVMAVVAVILAAIFVYDFASGASATSKVSQETKRIYILQNALKKPMGLPRRSSTSTTSTTSTTILPQLDVNGTHEFDMQDRLDDTDPRELAYTGNAEAPEKTEENSRSPRTVDERPETRGQSLENFKQRTRLLGTIDAKQDSQSDVEGKQLFNNHAVVYRVKQRHKYPDPEDEFNEEESRPAPFHFELKTPQPASFDKRPKFPQLTQYRYPHSSRNIQDIIKYLTNDQSTANRGIKFTGVYVNPTKYDLLPETGEMMANSDRHAYLADGAEDDDDEYDENEDDRVVSGIPRYAAAANSADPFYQWKPRHPTDVNLLAPSNVRFSPVGIHRYNPYRDPYFQRIPSSGYVKPLPEIPQYVDNAGAYSSGNYGKRKPKPFSVMLDIYPITDLTDRQPSNKISRPRLPPPGIEEYDPRRPISYNRGQRYHPPTQQGQSIPIVAVPAGQTGLSEEEERQQMIFHLNLYPRKKNKRNRNDIIQRSESMPPEDHEKFMHSVMSPFEAITKHLTDHSAIEESKYEETDLPALDESRLASDRANFGEIDNENHQSKKNSPPANSSIFSSVGESEGVYRSNSTEGLKTTVEKISADEECENCQNSKGMKGKLTNSHRDLDTPEGFQEFADGLLADE